MRKIFIAGSLLFCVFSAPLSFGSESLYTEDDSSDDENNDFRSAFDGFFIGGGFIRSSIADKVINTMDYHLFEGNLNFTAVAPISTQVIHQSLYDGSGIELIINSMDANVGLTHVYKFTSKASEGYRRMMSRKSNNVSTSFTAGYSLLAGSLYYGAQFSIDCCKKRKKEEIDNSYKGFGKLQLESGGVTPSISALFGKYYQNSVFGVKLGVCNRKSNLINEYGSIKLSKTAPTIGLFYRVGVSSRLSFGVEVDYLLRINKKGQLKGQKNVLILTDVPPAPPVEINLKHIADVTVRNKGYVVRITGTYRI